MEQRETVDTAFGELNYDKNKKFVSSLIREIDLRMDEYLLDFAEDKLSMEREEIPPYDPKLLKLIAIDFVS